MQHSCCPSAPNLGAVFRQIAEAVISQPDDVACRGPSLGQKHIGSISGWDRKNEGSECQFATERFTHWTALVGISMDLQNSPLQFGQVSRISGEILL
jgi:hypothetical protein